MLAVVKKFVVLEESYQSYQLLRMRSAITWVITEYRIQSDKAALAVEHLAASPPSLALHVL